MNHSVSFTPSTEHIEEIEKWLIEEKASSGEGFYCNWSIIKNFFKREELAVLLVEDKPVGFCCWGTTSDFTGQINIFEIKPDSRGKGLGASFAKNLENLFISKNIYVIDLQCEPENSETFWRKFNFIDVPKNVNYWGNQTVSLFKRLVPAKQEVAIHNGSNYIEMWDAEPYAIRNKDSKWKWNLDLSDVDKLSLPIIQPCEKDWRIKLVLEDKIVVDDKIKRFGGIEIDYGPYAIINKLPYS